MNCEKCRKEITTSGYVRALEHDYHTDCFTCVNCRVNLSKIKFLANSGDPWCRVCYYRKFGQNCGVCTEPIAPLTNHDDDGLNAVNASGNSYHIPCFNCSVCGDSLYGDAKSAYSDQGLLFCEDHYMNEKRSQRSSISAPSISTTNTASSPSSSSSSVSSELCAECGKTIKSAPIKLNSNTFLHPTCFMCTHCGISLNGVKFMSRNDERICLGCVEKDHENQCHRCHKPILPNSEGKILSVAIGDHRFHENCLTCKQCDIPFSDETRAAPHKFEDEYYCKPCCQNVQSS